MGFLSRLTSTGRLALSICRDGRFHRFPLSTVTIAVVVEAQERFTHPAELSDTMAELKRYGKTKSDSVVVRERRSAPGMPELVPALGCDDETEST